MKLYNRFEIPDKMFGLDSALLVAFIPLLGLLLCLIFVLNLIFLPKISDLNELMSKIAAVEKETKDINAKRTYLLSVDQEELKKNATYVENALLPEKNSYLLIGVIRQIADKYGFSVESFQVKLGEILKKSAPTSVVDAVAKVPVSFRLYGPRKQYLDLVNGLEKSLPILSIENFEMATVDTDNVGMNITVSASYVGNIGKININKLSLTDLTLKQDESELITKLSQDFALVTSNTSTGSTEKQFVDYGRTDPFNL